VTSRRLALRAAGEEGGQCAPPGLPPASRVLACLSAPARGPTRSSAR
jgi:hypothetical protein